MSKKTISLRVDEALYKKIENESKDMDLSKTDYIINRLKNSDIDSINIREEIVKKLYILSSNLTETERDEEYTSEKFSLIKEGIEDLWHMLK